MALSTTPSSDSKLPPLLALPMELTLQIISYLDVPEPSMIALRRSHPTFHSIIPKGLLLTKLTDEGYIGLLLARGYPSHWQRYMFPTNHVACSHCLRVLPTAKFGNTQLNRHAKDRFCVECGLKEHKYGLFGQEVRNNDIIHKVVWCICNRHEPASFCVGEERIEFKVVHCPPNHGYGSVLRVYDGDHIVNMKPLKAMQSLEKEKSIQGSAE